MSQKRAARLIEVREDAKRVAAELSTNPAGERSVPEAHGFEPGTAEMIEQKLRTLMKNGSNSAMMVIGTEMIVNNESKNLLTARTFVPFFDANGKIRYALEGDTDESFTAEELTSSALSQLRIISLEPNLTEKEKAELDADRARHKLGYQHLYYKVTDLSDVADEPVAREGASSSPVLTGVTALGAHAQRILDSFDVRAKSQKRIFESLSKRPGEDVTLEMIGHELSVGSRQVSQAARALSDRGLIVRKESTINAPLRYAGKPEHELASISLKRYTAPDVSGLGENAQRIYDGFRGVGEVQKAIFAHLSTHQRDSFSVATLSSELGINNTETTRNAVRHLHEKHFIHEISFTDNKEHKYQGKTEQQLAKVGN